MKKGSTMSQFRSILSASVLLLSMAFPSMAIVGVGIHWGNDLTLRMDDAKDEQLGLAGLKINITSIDSQANMPPELTEISAENLPIYINRTGWDRTPFNFGAKIYIDIIPLIDAVEFSSNFGWWEYDGSIKYPKSLAFKNVNISEVDGPEDLFEAEYDILPITMEEFDMSFLGFKKTPYMKLNFDLTARKYIAQFPKSVKLLKLYGGAGLSVHFATPILNKGLIEDALGDAIEGAKDVAELGTDIFANKEVAKKIIKEITSNLMTPHWGCHLDLGVMVKLPVIPVGIYVDGKLMIPFDNMDKNVDLGGAGFLLNTGISLSF
jgi:hypothetical protein